VRRARDGERGVIGFSMTALPDAAGDPRRRVVFRDLAPIERSGERERLQQRLARSARWPRARARAAQSARGHGGARGPAPAPPARRSRSLSLVIELRGRSASSATR
jgi:hypothetical protein